MPQTITDHSFIYGFKTQYSHPDTTVADRNKFNLTRFLSFIPIISTVGALIKMCDFICSKITKAVFIMEFSNKLSELSWNSLVEQVDALTLAVNSLKKNDQSESKSLMDSKEQLVPSEIIRAAYKNLGEAFEAMAKNVDNAEKLAESVTTLKEETTRINEIRKLLVEQYKIKEPDHWKTHDIELEKTVGMIIDYAEFMKNNSVIEKNFYADIYRTVMKLFSVGFLMIPVDIMNTAWAPKKVVPLTSA